jgi:hypothetical protein
LTVFYRKRQHRVFSIALNERLGIGICCDSIMHLGIYKIFAFQINSSLAQGFVCNFLAFLYFSRITSRFERIRVVRK